MKLLRLSSILMAATLCLSGCSKFSPTPMTYTDTVFDTTVSIQVYGSNDKKILEQCQKICKSYEEKFSKTIETSEIAKINTAQGAAVEVSSDTLDVIKSALYYGKLSNGSFDITIAPVSGLWDFKAKSPAPPDEAALKSALSHVDYKKIVLKDNTVLLPDASASIDLGGIAKGYIADRLKEYLESEGIKSALINLGGNVLAIGDKPDGTPFNIGIQRPFNDKGEPLASVKIKDRSVVTSGTYQRYFELDNTLYHHVLDPQTGKPCNNGLSSVTIIAETSTTADALSTACFVLGPEKGMSLVNQLDDVDAVFVDNNNKITYSNNFKY